MPLPVSVQGIWKVPLLCQMLLRCWTALLKSMGDGWRNELMTEYFFCHCLIWFWKGLKCNCSLYSLSDCLITMLLALSIVCGGVFLHQKSKEMDMLGFSVILHASPIEFNQLTPQSGTKVRFIDIAALPSLADLLPSCRYVTFSFAGRIKLCCQADSVVNSRFIGNQSIHTADGLIFLKPSLCAIY